MLILTTTSSIERYGQIHDYLSTRIRENEITYEEFVEFFSHMVARRHMNRSVHEAMEKFVAERRKEASGTER